MKYLVAIGLFVIASQHVVYGKEVVDYDDSDMERLFQQWEVSCLHQPQNVE